MYISLLKTKDNQIARESETFEEAWSFLQRISQGRNDVIRAVVLEETEDNYLDDQDPDFDSLKEVASMRLVP